MTTPTEQSHTTSSEAPTKRLYRSTTDRMLGGVAGGAAAYAGIDSSIMRIIFVILILLPGISIIAYLIAWVLIPEQPSSAKQSDLPTPSNHTPTIGQTQSSRQFLGLVLIGLGAFFLVRPFIDFNLWGQFWPAVLILIGLAIILGRKRK